METGKFELKTANVGALLNLRFAPNAQSRILMSQGNDTEHG